MRQHHSRELNINMMRNYPATICFFLLAGCASANTQPSPASTIIAARGLAETIDSIADAPPMQHTTWGIEVVDQQTGRILYQRNGDRHYIPASNTKLVVTTVAMGMLGPDYRYRTPVLAGTISGTGVVNGLVITGTGDPTFSARFWGTPYAAAIAFADSIYAAGVRRINGPLVIDASRFTDAPINGTWEVGDLPGGSAPPVGAFAMEEGLFRVVLSPGPAAGATVTASLPSWPSYNVVESQPMSTVRVHTDTAGARGTLDVDYLARRDSIYFSGRVPLGRPDTGTYSITDPPLYAARAIAAALDAKGVNILGGVRIARDSASASEARNALGPSIHTIATMTSPPLSDIVSAILHPSQNWIAEMLLKTLGAEKGTTGSWRSGLAVERTYLTKTIGLDSLDFNLRDASGMAPQNLLSPRAIVRILEHARTAPWGAQYVAALAAPGEPGTLNARLKEYQGRLRGKTGTISNVATLSGYLVTDNGRPVTFSIMTNGTGLGSATVRRPADEIVRVIARMTPR
jgi:D-alanyl-D-alanine carboxypeptidase/D-alanyl-D-alanine-endopeptidase (penicillin-binding protein 4)